ncbi:hypothetical protein RD1_0837 [Roseobacter denitrificans OCh 114]|uniref:Uncharacterized protein n=1 Tax=Roseobacter denitrificans (strain ATCC 33942 / OCh 114) TaxID=375451 RepID=Q16BY3_ROSDO|nr:hypothetical protein RD1_0837 [Roseobacter denitrificans OCh 114]
MRDAQDNITTAWITDAIDKIEPSGCAKHSVGWSRRWLKPT